MLSKDLFKHALVDPAKAGADTLLIVSGYASPAMAYKHFENIPKLPQIKLVVGMTYDEGIPRPHHAGFLKLTNKDFQGRFECRYVSKSPAVHSKAYAWLKNGRPYVGFIGSANYSQQAFLKRRELLVEADPARIARYYDSIVSDSISCLDPRVDELIGLTEIPPRPPRVRAPEGGGPPKKTPPPPQQPGPTISISLLDRNGELPGRSGLNWGQRPELRRNPNQAYIRVPAEVARSGFLPLRGQHFTVFTDDGESFDAVVAQDGSKAIETPLDNALLGRYFRRRLGLPDGALIRAADLTRYGRTTVDFEQIDPETYRLNFAVRPR
jgi:hypothetical protein